MRIIGLNAKSWKTPLDFLRSLASALGAPASHGMGPAAFVDSMVWGGMNRVEPPYVVQIENIAEAPTEVADYILLMASFIEEARQERFQRRGDMVEVSISTEPRWKKVVQLVGVSACPRCGNQAFDYEPGTDIDDPKGLVRCGKCGHVCAGDEFLRRL